MEFPNQEKILLHYYERLYTRDNRDELLKQRMKTLERPDKVMCTCFKIFLKKNYQAHTLSKAHIEFTNRNSKII